MSGVVHGKTRCYACQEAMYIIGRNPWMHAWKADGRDGLCKCCRAFFRYDTKTGRIMKIRYMPMIAWADEKTDYWSLIPYDRPAAQWRRKQYVRNRRRSRK